MRRDGRAAGGRSVRKLVRRGVAAAEQAAKAPTPKNELGPFYRRGAPSRATLSAPGDPGMPLIIAGAIYDTRGEIRPDATLEIWQADHLGHYNIEGYKYRAMMTPDVKGAYHVETVMPGHYPDRVAQHVHYLVKAPGCKPLVTQLYFATDPVFEGDPDRKFNADPLVAEPRARQARAAHRRSRIADGQSDLRALSRACLTQVGTVPKRGFVFQIRSRPSTGVGGRAVAALVLIGAIGASHLRAAPAECAAGDRG